MRFNSLLLVFLFAFPVAGQTTLIESGRAALRKGDADTASFLLRRAVAEAPNSSEAHYWLGVAYGREARRVNMFRQFKMAIRTREEFERSVQLDPGNLRARFALVEFYTLAPIMVGGGNWKAFPQAKEITRNNPAMGHEALAFIFADEKRYREAFEQLEESVRIDPLHMPAWFQIGHLAAITGSNLARGEEALQKYLSATPASDEDDPSPARARALYWLGVIYEKGGRAAEARESYAASLRLDPSQKDVREAIAHSR